MEIWKAIEGFDGEYEISNRGRVISLKFGQINFLTLVKDKAEYCRVKLTKGEDSRYHSVHRLVVKAFIGPIGNKLEVNHLDGDKSNNHVCNLEIVTGFQNKKHARETGLWKPVDPCPVVMFNPKTFEVIKEFSGTVEAAKEVGVYPTGIVRACNGVQKTSGGFAWKYKEEGK